MRCCFISRKKVRDKVQNIIYADFFWVPTTFDVSLASDPIQQIFPLTVIEFFIKHLHNRHVSTRV